LLPIPTPTKNKTIDEYIASLNPKIQKVNDIARENFFEQQQKIKEAYDRTAAPPNFKIGQEIYVHDPQTPLGYSKKLHNRFRKRYIIVSRESYTNFRIKDKNTGKELRRPIHCSRFRKVELDRSLMAKNGPELDITPLPTIDEIPEIESNLQYQSDFPADYTDLFETLPESEMTPSPSHIYPDSHFDLNDRIPQEPSPDFSPSLTPEPEIFSENEPSPIYYKVKKLLRIYQLLLPPASIAS